MTDAEHPIPKLSSEIPKRKRRSRWPVFALYVVLTLLLLVYSLPTIGVALTALKQNAEIAREGVWNLPDHFSLQNFKDAWETGNAGKYMINSFKVTIPASVFSIAFGVLTGYTLAKLSFRGSDALFIFLVAGLFFPPQIVMIPLFRMFNSAGLYDTLWPLIIVHVAFGIPICTLVLKNFFSTIPTAIREAAIIDGANEAQVLVQVMVPLSLPALAVLATLQFTWIWNDFLWPVILTRSDDVRTVMFGVASLKGQYSVAYGTQSAMSIMASIPTLLIFIFFQKYFIRGLTLGSVKG
ncbi:MAG: carbohydrate ABC transporter permease [Chloroflexi bacterium]|nr:carbohydrate ABC transporter permease [Chloroflexota bacterium]